MNDLGRQPPQMLRLNRQMQSTIQRRIVPTWWRINLLLIGICIQTSQQIPTEANGKLSSVQDHFPTTAPISHADEPATPTVHLTQAAAAAGSGESDFVAASIQDDSATPHHSHPHPKTIRFHGATYTRNDLLDRSPPSVQDSLIGVGTRAWYLYMVGTIICVCLAALAAGLTVGLVSIDPFDLAVIQTTEESDCSTVEEIVELRQEKEYASKLMPLVQQHHLLLVTLLIMNSFANELLPLLLDNLVPSWVAVVLSVSFVLLFGEILPSSIFTGKNQLRLAASLTPLVYFFEVVLFVIAYPIAWILDHTLGVEDESRLRRSELKSLIRLGASNRGTSMGGSDSRPSPTNPNLSPNGRASGSSLTSSETTILNDSVLSTDEMNILHGVLEMKDRTVQDAMVDIDDVFMLPLDTILDLNQLANIIHQGHSRIPIYDGSRSNIRGVLLVKRLIVVNPEDKRPLRTIATRWPLLCSPTMPLLDILNLFQTGRSHMAIVCTDPTTMMNSLRAEEPVPDSVQVLGVITIEDVLELLIKEEISDETDLGVRTMLDHSTVVRRRIERLKILALKMATGPAKPQFKHRRAASSASVSRVASLTTTATTTTVGASVTLPYSYQNDSTYPPSSSISDVKVSMLDLSSSDVLRPSTSATPAPPLPRDDLFTRSSRSSSIVSRSPSVPTLSATSTSYALPPQPITTPPSAIVPTAGISRPNSLLTPKSHFTSDAMRRPKEVDSETMAALRPPVLSASSNTLAQLPTSLASSYEGERQEAQNYQQEDTTVDERQELLGNGKQRRSN